MEIVTIVFEKDGKTEKHSLTIPSRRAVSCFHGHGDWNIVSIQGYGRFARWLRSEKRKMDANPEYKGSANSLLTFR